MAEAKQLTYTEYDTGYGYGHEPLVHRVLVIEYRDGRPFSVVTDNATFDFEYCRRDDALLFQDTGSGLNSDEPSYQVCAFCDPAPPPGAIWTDPEVSLHRWESAEKPNVPVDDAMLLAMGYVRLKHPLRLASPRGGLTCDPFEVGEECDGRMEYCSICDDRLPEDNLCDHLCCSECSGEFIGSGGQEPDEASMFAAFDWLATLDREEWSWCEIDKFPNLVCVLQSLLLADKFPPTCTGGCCVLRSAKDSDCWDDMEDGFAWLQTLRPDTKAANAKTLQWILNWRLSRKERK